MSTNGETADLMVREGKDTVREAIQKAMPTRE